MGTRPRPRPNHLAAKLRAIREQLGLSQGEIAPLVGLKKKGGNARVSEYEKETREPPLFVLLGYARVAGICTCVLIDDEIDLAEIKPREQGRTHSHVHTSVSKERIGQKGR